MARIHPPSFKYRPPRAKNPWGRSSSGPPSAGSPREMRAQRPTPISRGLARIIKDSSRAAREDDSMDEHMRCIEARQATCLEFYLSACALRLRCEPAQKNGDRSGPGAADASPPA